MKSAGAKLEFGTRKNGSLRVLIWTQAKSHPSDGRGPGQHHEQCLAKRSLWGKCSRDSGDTGDTQLLLFIIQGTVAEVAQQQPEPRPRRLCPLRETRLA